MLNEFITWTCLFYLRFHGRQKTLKWSQRKEPRNMIENWSVLPSSVGQPLVQSHYRHPEIKVTNANMCKHITLLIKYQLAMVEKTVLKITWACRFSTTTVTSGAPNVKFGKYLFGRRFEIQNFRNICCKISYLPASPRIFEHLKRNNCPKRVT